MPLPISLVPRPHPKMGRIGKWGLGTTAHIVLIRCSLIILWDLLRIIVCLSSSVSWMSFHHLACSCSVRTMHYYYCVIMYELSKRICCRTVIAISENEKVQFHATSCIIKHSYTCSVVRMYNRPALSIVTNVQKSGENRMYFPNVPFSNTVLTWLPSVFHHCMLMRMHMTMG